MGLPVVSGGAASTDFGAIDLPAPRAARPPAPAPTGGFGSVGDFGSLDLGTDDGEGGAVDLPATRDAAPDPYGGVDLPAVRAMPSGVPSVFGGGGRTTAPNPGLPMPAGPAAGLPMPAGRPGGIGDAGLPMPARGAHQGPTMAGVGAGLPAIAGGHAGLPASMGGGAGLPAVAGGHAGLPVPSGHGAGLPAAGGGGAGLPAFGGGAGLPAAGGFGAGLPAAGGFGAGLPAAGGFGAGLPAAGGFGAGLPAAGGFGAGLPAAGGAGLPTTGGPGLPAAGGGGLPAVGGAGLPIVNAAGLPVGAGPGLPSMSSAGLPVVGAAGLPATGGQGLPLAAQAQGFPERKLSGVMPAGIGLDMPSAGGEAQFGEFDPHAGGVNVGSVDLGQLGGGGPGANVGGEMDLDAPGGAPKGTGALFRKERKADTGEDDFAEAPRRSGLKYVAVGMAGFTLVGALMTFNPAWGPFGSHLISDKINASAYDEAVVALRASTVSALDEDTLVAATTAAEKARGELRERERHKDTAAYTAFVINMRSLRFGRDGGMETTAKALLEALPKENESVPLLLAMASSDALDGELARARQTVANIQAKEPEDVDAAVLAGEIELKSKDPAAAVAAFSKATNLHKSARTLYGLARAQLAAGKRAEAEATARGALESSPSHVGARILIATIAATSATREAEALKLLTEVTAEDGPLKPLASSPELVEAFVQLGRVQTSASKITQAQEAFAGALRLDPQSVAALVGSGELYYRSARFSEAEARFESALKADADSLDAKIGTAKTWIALERTKEAKDHLTKLLAAYPKEPMVHYWGGRVNELLGQRKDAESDFRKAIENAKTPEQGVPSYVALAALLASTNRAGEAATLLQDASKNYPGSAELAKARGEVALRSGKLEEALGQFEAALKKAPDDLSTRFFIAQTLMKMRKFDQAVAVLDAIQKIDPEYPGLSLERGLYFEETGQSEEALRMYEAALKKAPNDVDLKLRIASTQVAAGAAKQAEPLLKEVIRERGNSAEANHFLGRSMLLSGSNLNEAMRHLRRAVELDANRAEYHLYVGWAANEAGQPELAEASLEKALELDATLGDAYWQRGVLNQKLGRVEKALKDLETALEKRPSRYEAHATMALCFEAQNNMSKAEASWRKAIAGNDRIAEFHYKLGELLERNGNKKDAMLELDKAVELGSSKEPRPAWLFRAYRLLGEGLEATNAEKSLGFYQEYLRLAPKDDAYRTDVEGSVEALRKKLNR